MVGNHHQRRVSELLRENVQQSLIEGMNMNNVLITGGAGFIGSEIVCQLNKA